MHGEDCAYPQQSRRCVGVGATVRVKWIILNRKYFCDFRQSNSHRVHTTWLLTSSLWTSATLRGGTRLRAWPRSPPSPATRTVRGPRRSTRSTSRRARAAATTTKTQQLAKRAQTYSRAVSAPALRAPSGRGAAPSVAHRVDGQCDLALRLRDQQREDHLSRAKEAEAFVSIVPSVVTMVPETGWVETSRIEFSIGVPGSWWYMCVC